MSILGSFQENRSLNDFGAKELVAGVLAAEDILGLEGFSIGARTGNLEDAEWSGLAADDVVGKDVFYLSSKDGEGLDGLERIVFVNLDSLMERLGGFHDGVLGGYYEDMKDCPKGKMEHRVEKALILLDDDGYMGDLWKAINAEIYQDVYAKFIGKNRDDLQLVHQMVFAGEELEYGGFDGAGRAIFDSLGYLADRIIAGKIMGTQSAFQVIEYGGHVCEVHVDNVSIRDFTLALSAQPNAGLRRVSPPAGSYEKEILDGSLLEHDSVSVYDSYGELIDVSREMILSDFHDIGLYRDDGSWGFYLSEKELCYIGLGEQLEQEKLEQRKSVDEIICSAKVQGGEGMEQGEALEPDFDME